MALADAYLELDEFKLRLGIEGTKQDAFLLAVLIAASRQIDGWCARTFNKTETAETRYFSVPARLRYEPLLDVHDYVSLDSVASDDGTRTWAETWLTTSYDVAPLTVGYGEPYRQIEALNGAVFPYGANAIAVSATWGWPSVPEPVREATHLIANRTKSLWRAPFGSTGAGELGGGLNMTDSTTTVIRSMLAPYRAISL